MPYRRGAPTRLHPDMRVSASSPCALLLVALSLLALTPVSSSAQQDAGDVDSTAAAVLPLGSLAPRTDVRLHLQNAGWPGPGYNASVPETATTRIVQPLAGSAGRLESALVGMAGGMLIGGAAFGVADGLFGPFWRDASFPAASVFLSTVVGAVYVGAPVGAIVGAVHGRWRAPRRGTW